MNVLTKNQFQFQRIAFVLLFVLSNLLFFQPTQAQDPFDGYTCDEQEGCRSWGYDTLYLYLPAPNEDCHYMYIFKWRDLVCKQLDSAWCGGQDSVVARKPGILEFQPVAVLIDFVNSNCGANVKTFYGDTNNIHRIESLMRLADKTAAFNHAKSMRTCPSYSVAEQALFKGYFVYDTISLSPLVIDSTLSSDTVLKMTFTRPACRGICISYFRADSNSSIDSVYAKWHNCGTACCEVISSFCNIEDLPNVPSEYLNDGISARINVEVNYTGDCSSTPSVVCPNSSMNTKVTKFNSCFDYCQDENGLDPFGLSNVDKNQSNVVKLNDKQVFSDKFLQSAADNVMFESTSNNLNLSVSEDVISIKLVSLTGNVLKSINVSNGAKTVNLTLSSATNGLYFLVFESKNSIVSKPLIIAK